MVPVSTVVLTKPAKKNSIQDIKELNLGVVDVTLLAIHTSVHVGYVVDWKMRKWFLNKDDYVPDRR